MRYTRGNNKKDKKMIGRFRRRTCGRRHFCLLNLSTIVFLLTILFTLYLFTEEEYEPNKLVTYQYTFEQFLKWNRSLCSIQSDNRGPHQKVIAISIYGSASKHTDNPMFSWDTSILPFLKPLANEVKELLPSWIIRVYIDFTGSTQSQRDLLYSYSNIDVCDINDLPMFGSSLVTYLPGKIWRFVPIFDPFVDYTLSRDLDSPIIQRETETLDLWLSEGHEKYIFHILRDHPEHGIPILGGLWGAAPVRARRQLFNMFYPVLVPSIARKYNGTGDQDFLQVFIWEKVKKRALSFDSYSCKQFDSRPFLSQRPLGNCFLGCIRACCTNMTETNPINVPKACPKACRPKDHQDWIYC